MSFDIEILKLTSRYRNVTNVKPLLDDLNLISEFYKARKERCNNEKEKDGIIKKEKIIDDLYFQVSRGKW